MDGRQRPARDLYIVGIDAPSRPGTFLAPSPIPLAFENLPDARYVGDLVLYVWLTPRPRGRALSGTTRMNPRRFFRAAAEQILWSLSLFLFSSSILHGLCSRPSVLGPISSRLTPPTLPAWRPGPFNRETPPSHTYPPSPSPHIPSVCVSLQASSFLLSLFTNHHV